MLKRLGLTAALALGLLSAPTLANDNWKLLVRVKGKVETRLAAAQSWKPVFSSRLLKDKQDMVRTHSDSIGQIRSEDGSAITVGPDTELRVAQFDPDAGRVELVLEKENGSVRAKVGKFFGGERSFKIKTLNSVLSARGTEFIVVSKSDNKNGSTTTMDVLSGVVSGNHGGETVKVEAGYRFTTDGQSYSITETPPDFLGVPQPLIPTIGAQTAAVERGTLTGDQGAETSVGVGSSRGGAYLNPMLPSFRGAETGTIQVNLTVIGQ